jgi:hypothetical protein
MYRIRPLDWKLFHSPNEHWSAFSVFGTIEVGIKDNDDFYWKYCFDEFYDEKTSFCESIPDGKAKAEAFYLERLLPALEAAT